MVGTAHNFQLGILYVMLTLGTTGLWMGEPDADWPYPILVAVAGAFAFILTDRAGVIDLPHWFSNLLAVVISMVVFAEFLRDASAVLTLAHFLVYLQMVKYFRRKEPYDIQQLMIINLLQLAIGCVVNRAIQFGGLLLLYMALAIFNLGLFQRQRHWGSVRVSARRALRWDFWFTLGLTAFCTLPLALITFWVLPRAGRLDPNATAGATTVPELVTGFSDKVRLNELGPILENDDVALNVWAKDRKGKSVNLPPNILWRGKVFLLYRRGEWFSATEEIPQGSIEWESEDFSLQENQVNLTIEQVVRTPEGAAGEILFAPRPLYWAHLDGNELLSYRRIDGRLVLTSLPQREAKTRNGMLNYRLVTTFDQNVTVYRDSHELPPSKIYLDAARSIPSNLTRLSQLAKDLVKDIPADDVDGRINAIFNYLTDEAEFGYTLDIQPVDGLADPIEDFLFNRKEGHCEYFASALALMLRSVGIPARVLNGFKGADRNEAGGYYQVRQLLAHSWVEAYIVKPGFRYWRTLDPTPGQARVQELERQRSPWQPFSELADAIRRLWYSYVVGYNDSEQKQLAYTILGEVSTQLAATLRAFAVMVWANAAEAATTGFWLSWRGALAGSLIAVLFVMFYRRRNEIWLWFVRKRFGVGRDNIRHAAVLAVYEEWLELLQRQSYRRQATQTAAEFAEVVRHWIQATPSLVPFVSLPIDLADAFYQARFGGRQVEAESLANLRNRVREFESALLKSDQPSPQGRVP